MLSKRFFCIITIGKCLSVVPTIRLSSASHTCGICCAGRCMPECQHIDNTRIYSRKDLAWFIIFVCAIYDFRDHSENNWNPESLQFQCQFESMIWSCPSVRFLKWLYFLIYCILWHSKLSLGILLWKVCILKKKWAPVQLKPFCRYSPLSKH